jgi:hypothetical protein
LRAAVFSFSTSLSAARPGATLWFSKNQNSRPSSSSTVGVHCQLSCAPNERSPRGFPFRGRKRRQMQLPRIKINKNRKKPRLDAVYGKRLLIERWLEGRRMTSIYYLRRDTVASRRHLTDSYSKRILDLIKVVPPPPTIGRRMERYSLEEPPGEEHGAEGTVGSRRAGIFLAFVGALMMALAMLGGWSPWSL